MLAERELSLHAGTEVNIPFVFVVFLNKHVVEIGEDAKNLLQVHVVPDLLSGLLLVHKIQYAQQNVLTSLVHRWVSYRGKQQGKTTSLEAQLEVVH